MTANSSSIGEGSVSTGYKYDDKGFWRDLRRQLLIKGISKSAFQRKKKLIKACVEDLCNTISAWHPGTTYWVIILGV